MSNRRGGSTSTSKVVKRIIKSLALIANSNCSWLPKAKVVLFSNRYLKHCNFTDWLNEHRAVDHIPFSYFGHIILTLSVFHLSLLVSNPNFPIVFHQVLYFTPHLHGFCANPQGNPASPYEFSSYQEIAKRTVGLPMITGVSIC